MSIILFISMSDIVFTPQPLRAVGVLFSPMVSGWAGGRWEIVCPGCISETVRCRKFILGRDLGWGVYLFYLFIWSFTSLSTLYRSYHDG